MHITHILGHRRPGRWQTAVATLTAACCVALALIAVGSPSASAAAHVTTGSEPGADRRAQAGSFTPGHVGDLDYYLYAPSAADGSRALPLVVHLHGCHQTAPDAAVGTRWNEQAEADGFLVLYPQQSPSRAADRCWHWAFPDSQVRDGGEAKLIADATRDVVARYRVDARRVFVLGSSAGGAMSVVMAATYPDVYAAAANYAGCGFAICQDLSGELAYRAMGPRARPVPLLTGAGTLDSFGWPGVLLVLPQWLGTSDTPTMGKRTGRSVACLPRRPSTPRPPTPTPIRPRSTTIATVTSSCSS